MPFSRLPYNESYYAKKQHLLNKKKIFKKENGNVKGNLSLGILVNFGIFSDSVIKHRGFDFTL